MNQRLIITTMTVASLLMACSPNMRKAPIQKSGGSSGPAADEPIELKKVNDIVSSNQGCFQLAELIKELNLQTGKSFSIHLRDFDFVVPPEASARNQDLRPWAEFTKADKKVEENATRARVLVTEERPLLFEMLNAEELMTSQILKPYIAVKEQTDCKTITFEDGKTFRIEAKTVAQQPDPQQQVLDQQQNQTQLRNRGTNNSGTRIAQKPVVRKKVSRGLTLIGIDKTAEDRTYTVVGNRLVITIIQSAGPIETCNKEINNSLKHKTEYVLNFSNKQKSYSITHRLADLLKTSLQNPGQLDSMKPGAPRTTLPRERGTGGGTNGYPISAEELMNYTRQITSGQFKTITCK